MDTATAFKHLIANWKAQRLEFRKKHRQRKSQFVTGKGVGDGSKRKILKEAGYKFHPEKWDIPE